MELKHEFRAIPEEDYNLIFTQHARGKRRHNFNIAFLIQDAQCVSYKMALHGIFQLDSMILNRGFFSCCFFSEQHRGYKSARFESVFEIFT